MQLTTAEIKRLINVCAADNEKHSPQEFGAYISRVSGGTFTKGQLAGAIAQLVGTGELINVERGVYRVGQGAEGNMIAVEAGLNGSSIFAQEIGQCLSQTITNLSEVVERSNVMEMNQAEFALLGEIKRLKEELELIVIRCN